jgi:hypothetical protein
MKGRKRASKASRAGRSCSKPIHQRGQLSRSPQAPVSAAGAAVAGRFTRDVFFFRIIRAMERLTGFEPLPNSAMGIFCVTVKNSQRYRMFRHVFALTIALSAVALAQASNTVPASLLLKAQRSAVEVAFLLANASVPSGLEIREADDLYPKPPPDYTLDLTQQVPASDVVKAFNAQHRDYQAAVLDGVFVIRPADASVRFLDEPSTIRPVVTIIGAMAAMRRVFAALDPELSGVVLNSLGHEGENTPVALDGTGNHKVIDTLNQVAKQTRSTWQVKTRKHGKEWRVAEFGVIHEHGTRDIHAMRDR